jgi:hypothetical protein
MPVTSQPSFCASSRIVEKSVACRLVTLALQVVTLVKAIYRCLNDIRVLAGLDLLLEPFALGTTSDVNFVSL